MKEEKSRIKSDILLRVRLLYLLFILAGLLIIIRLIWVQLFSSEVAYNADRLAGRIFTEEIIPAQRGSILTRNGDPLATSIFRYQVEFDFGSPGLDSIRTFHEQSDSLSKLLAAYFRDKPASEYRKMFRSEHNKRYRVIFRKDTLVARSEGWFARLIDRILDRELVPKKLYDTIRDHTPVPIFPREIDYTEWQTLRKYPLLNWNMGMVYNLVETDERVYPQGELGRRTIGLTGNRGNYGIEAVYRDELAGRDGKTTRQRIARGFYGRVVDGDNQDPVDGMDVVTTLDLDVQDVADKYLREQMIAQNAIWGTTIVMEVKTGEIIAMVNLGRTPSGNYAERENYAIGRSTEPGSTFKLASMLLLLEDANMPLSQTYDTGNGRVVMVGGIRVQDSHAGFHDMDFRTAVAQSSNVYFAKAIWERYANDKERYSDFMKHLHLDKTVGLEAFGEKEPLFQDWKEVPDPNSMLIRRSFGYRIKLAPIQVITFYNAIANNGKMISPLLVKEFRRGDDVLQRFRSQTLVDQICSPGTLQQVQSLLESVGTEGTGAGFFRDTTLYRVAAKTGTAQYADDKIGYRDGYYVGSMAAYFPADNPRYTVLTTIHTKRQAGKAYYGGPLSGPVVKKLITYLYNREHDWKIESVSGDRTYYPDRIKGGNITQTRKVAGQLSPRVSSDERTGWGTVRIDSLSHVSITAEPQQAGIMPDVVGMGLKDALFLLESQGLKVSFSGKGTVRSQSIAPGAHISRGGAVSITLR
ncbi:MAG TPA: transpeptidase family protein [Candidatus Alistipes avicola]|uniref:Transpeptidase family protein n=1 Tax=Candidatus Alistipes avicola TaxID=2838432 RepID=A0A9D2IBU8_9BACT|nr:penicillin-binding protein [uncultured Alistipes sp.]HJA98390.1 transpeptidase family protein [Candidatus Alistipes avicola]